MAVRGTENFVYYTDKILGAGSTGTVYFGRHKRKGDSCAIKIFISPQGSNTKIQVRENELEFMRKLQHKNIVSLISIEKDSRSAEIALIMELCSEGSLQKRLSEPQYLNGLSEIDCKDFVGQFADGLHYLRLHGITHRDIKPGNILCTKTEDGRILYKITDFGSSRELFVQDKSKALYGTEEYLHPHVYRCIFIEKTAYGDEYEIRAELWSIGVTLYQVACGRLPFQALGGRNNRNKMYEIISRKGPNIISGIQKENSQEIQYSRTFPENCLLSLGIKEILIPMISNLLEIDENFQMPFDDFFPKCEQLQSTKVIYIFSVVSGSFIYIYLQPTDRFSNLQKAVEKQTKILSSNQIYFFNSRRLTDIISADECLSMYPVTSEDTPFLLIPCNQPNWETIEFKPPFPSAIPNLSGDRNLSTDATWSRDACAFCFHLLCLAQVLSNIQISTRRSMKWLADDLRTEFANLKERFRKVESNYSSAKFNVKLASAMITKRIVGVVESAKKEFDLNKSKTGFKGSQEVLLMDASKELLTFKADYNEKLEDIDKYVKRVDRLAAHINDKIENSEQVMRVESEKVFSDCDTTRCIIKLENHYKQARDTYEQFAKDKKRALTYNEDQIHKYQRIKLEEVSKIASSIINQHCLQCVSALNDKFRIWFRNCFVVLNHINHLQIDVQKFHDECNRITNSVSKINTDCESQLQTVCAKIKLTVTPVSNPVGASNLLQPSSGYCTQSATEEQMQEELSESGSELTLITDVKSLRDEIASRASVNKTFLDSVIKEFKEENSKLMTDYENIFERRQIGASNLISSVAGKPAKAGPKPG